MYSIAAEGVPVGYATFIDAQLSSNCPLVTATPNSGTALPTNADSAIVLVSGTFCWATFDGTAASASKIKLPVGTYIFLNCRTALTKCNIIESDASTRVDIYYTSVMGR